MGSVALGGVVGFRYGECRLPGSVEEVREDLRRQMRSVQLAQIGTAGDADAAALLAGDEERLAKYLGVMDSLPDNDDLRLWWTLAVCPSGWLKSS